MDPEAVERTLIIFKHDAVQRGLVGEILNRFERVGLKIIGTKMVAPDREHYEQHYEGIGKLRSRRGDHTADITLDMMTEGPVIAMVLEGIEAVENVRKLIGPTEPKSAQPGTIRGDYAHISFRRADSTGKGIPNLIHASADSEEASQEIAHWFTGDQLIDYSALNEKYTR